MYPGWLLKVSLSIAVTAVGTDARRIPPRCRSTISARLAWYIGFTS